MTDLSGRTAIVVGGSTGIGLAAVHELAARGAHVALCGIDQSGVDTAVAEVRAAGGSVDGVALDVRDSAAVDGFVRNAAALSGRVDILVCSAGIQRYGTVVETDESVWDEVLSVNLKGVYLAARATIPHMPRGGAVVVVSSVQAFATQQQVAAYTASKAGLMGLVRAMAVDHAADGIRVNAVCPGSVDTPMLRASAELFAADGETADDVVAQWGKAHPLGRVATPAEVGRVVAFLAGDQASFVTGTQVTVDGGLLAGIAVALPE